MGCGSDDWSVDSDYAFQEFPDDEPSMSEHHSPLTPRHETEATATTTNTATQITRTERLGFNAGGLWNPDATHDVHNGHKRHQNPSTVGGACFIPEGGSSMSVAATTSSKEGGAATDRCGRSRVDGIVGDEKEAGRLTKEGSYSQQHQQQQRHSHQHNRHHRHCGGDGEGGPGSMASCDTARQSGDPGSSTDSMHILRLEQRMFLKVS